MSSIIQNIVSSNRKNKKGALICICSAHPDVIEASFSYLKKQENVFLSIESTVQQVNQDGGYTGMKPKDFASMVRAFAVKYGINDEAYILAGDHLGPNAWKKLPSAEAMAKSLVLIAQCVEAGYTKLHIDPSMSCVDDPSPLPIETIALRTAMMIKEAEKTALKHFGTAEKLFYIVGTEVPVPGGAQEHEDHVSSTPLAEVEKTITIIKECLQKEDLSHVWSRVQGLVVQPGVEFGDDFVAPYKAGQAASLFNALTLHPQMVFEAHSTDYQTKTALKALVKDHFAILKVGPELTFAWREALFALDRICQEATGKSPNIREALQKEMLSRPENWAPYYKGTPEELAYKRIYSLSDRIRYYWASPSLAEAVSHALPQYEKCLRYALLSQYLPWVLETTDKREHFTAKEILLMAVERVIRKYDEASQG